MGGTASVLLVPGRRTVALISKLKSMVHLRYSSICSSFLNISIYPLAKMRSFVLLSLAMLCVANPSPPLVAVYTFKPLEAGQENTLLCHAKEFNPPNINLELYESNKVFDGANQTDLSFESNWKFKLTKFIKLIPKKDAEYSCHVMHMGTTSIYKLETF